MGKLSPLPSGGDKPKGPKPKVTKKKDETRTLGVGCMVCDAQSEIEIPLKISKALGESVLIVCKECSQKTPEELEEEWTWRWVKTKR